MPVPRLFDYLVRMGHAPFQYPTPEGYSDRAVHWMGTLLWRWKFAVALSRNEIHSTTVHLDRCVEDFGGESGLAAHILGRRPLAERNRELPHLRGQTGAAAGVAGVSEVLICRIQ